MTDYTWEASYVARSLLIWQLVSDSYTTFQLIAASYE